MNPPPTEAQRFEALYRAHYAAIVRFVRRRTSRGLLSKMNSISPKPRSSHDSGRSR